MALSGCAIIPQPASDGFARLGQSTRIAALNVRPEAVIEDSRCPMNARCIWAGRVVIEASVWQGGVPERRQFTLGDPAADGLMLDTVEPGRTTDGPIAPKDYRFHFSMQPQ
ncbi:MAG: hypothetical protein C0409_06370 [Novosphingobium sp.]|nr:hypothetical protein [Novosphingobium sp.]